MSESDDHVLKLIGMAYDAALDEQKWPSFLEAFASAAGGSSAILRSNIDLNKSASFQASIGYEPAWHSAYCNHFVKLDYFNHIMNQYVPGKIFSSDQHMDTTELGRSEYYNDYLRPQDKVHAFGSFLLREGGNSLVFGIQRGRRAGAFGGEEFRLLSILIPHLTRAVQVHRKISTLTVEKESALGALDLLRMGVILTNSVGALLFVNRAAEKILAKNAGIGCFHNRLVLNSPHETALLYKLIADAAQSACGVAVGSDMRIALSSGYEFLHCLVTPVSMEFNARWNLSLGTDCVAIFLTQPGGLELSPQRLAVLYKITPAESRLAAQLAAFSSVDEAAKDMGISVFTARSHLKSIFAKTGVRSQAELLMLLATGTVAHCSNE